MMYKIMITFLDGSSMRRYSLFRPRVDEAERIIIRGIGFDDDGPLASNETAIAARTWKFIDVKEYEEEE